jgi:Aminotransferase class I and II
MPNRTKWFLLDSLEAGCPNFLAKGGPSGSYNRTKWFLLDSVEAACPNFLACMWRPPRCAPLYRCAMTYLPTVLFCRLPKLLYVIPVHHNPCGTVLPAERRRHLVSLAERYGFTIIADEVYQVRRRHTRLAGVGTLVPSIRCAACPLGLPPRVFARRKYAAHHS